MSSESFKILKEINSLTLTKEKITLELNKELARVHSLIDIRQTREAQKESALSAQKEKNLELQKTENQISDLQLKLEKDKTSLSMASSENIAKSLELQIKDRESKAEVLELQGMDLLEELDGLETVIKDANSFLSGSLETLKEIEEEVSGTSDIHQQEINKLTKRIDLLFVELPQQFQDRYKSTIEKKIKGSSFTRLKNDSCEYCRYGLSRMDIIDIEDKLMLKNCNGCGRIILPQQAFY